MSSPGTSFTENERRTAAQGPIDVRQLLTAEERTAIIECMNEGLYSRSLPFSFLSMVITRALVSRGVLSAHPKLGWIPKVTFAGFFGFLVGKISSVQMCQKRLKIPENLLGRIGQGEVIGPSSQEGAQTEFNNPGVQSFDNMFGPAETSSHRFSQSSDYGFAASQESNVNTGKADDFRAPDPPYVEDEPRKKPVFYDELRLKNRENYEVTLSQKADTMLRAAPEKEPEKLNKAAKKNIYGDVWEE